jgi:cytidylate kinase
VIITIDGPAVSGKSTTALALAKELHCFYLYSGLLFRSAAYVLHEYGHHDADTIASVSASGVEQYMDHERLHYCYSEERGAHILFDRIDITSHLYTPMISQLASIVGTNSHVREAIEQLEHHIAAMVKIDMIVDGRDSGSVVFPHAEHKFYLIATLEERARRMQKSLQKEGVTMSYENALHEISKRDERDSRRAQHPLTIPKDALVIDTTNKTREEVAQIILDSIRSF